MHDNTPTFHVRYDHDNAVHGSYLTKEHAEEVEQRLTSKGQKVYVWEGYIAYADAQPQKEK